MNQSVRQSVVQKPPASAAAAGAAPKQVVRPVDAVALIVGIVVGAGIFRTPSLVASNAASEGVVYFAWILGGVMSILGAMVYAELATAYPHAGGDYYYLSRAFGSRLGFLFGWARLSVIQTGSIASVSFIFGNYASQIIPLGQYSAAVYAVLAVLVLTAVNLAGVRQGTGTQNLLTTLEVLGIVLVIAAGLTSVAPQPAATDAPATPPATSSFGLMMVFVLFTYGGWNEAAYVSAELRDVRRNMSRVLIAGLLTITVLYVTINWAYLHALGLGGVGGSQQVAADVMGQAFGSIGTTIISVLIAIAALTTANATVFTGGRSSYAFGCDFREFAMLGRWNAQTGTPVNGLLVQGGVALALILLGVFTQKGFETVVEYTAPVFWFFFMLTGIAFFLLRHKDASISRPFRVPLYPVPPLLFTGMCGYLLYSSLAYTGIGALAGVTVLAIGAVLLMFVHRASEHD
jgi:APA family basic amino acid/polyamine antiporter